MFWISVSFILYTYLGYPLLITLIARLKAKPVNRYLPNPLPSVSMVIAAYNEERRIKDKLENSLALDYPRSKFEIIVVSDGSSDKTNEIVRNFADSGVKLIALPQRGGKAHALNIGVSKAAGDIILFSDARQLYDKNALKEIIANFNDKSIGAVSGELHLVEELKLQDGSFSEAIESVGFYWRYEKMLRKLESKIDSTVGATGAIYAIRKKLFQSIPEDTILDDVLIPMRVVLQGYRVIFESKAKAFDTISPNPKAEFVRKTRTLAGNFQLFLRHRELYNPFRNRILLQMISHKLFRLIVPLALFCAFTANAFLLKAPFYRITFVVQLLLYLSAISWALVPQRCSKFRRLLSIPHTFLMLNAAVLVGFYRYITRKQRITWDRAQVDSSE